MPGLLGLLDLIAAPSPEQARGLLSDLVAAPRNRLRGLLDNPIGFANDALQEGLFGPPEVRAARDKFWNKEPMTEWEKQAYTNQLLNMGMAGMTNPGGYKGKKLNDLAYQIEHKPMSVAGGAATLDDAERVFGPDIFGQNALQYFGSGTYAKQEKAAIDLMRKVRGNPDAMVTVYRGVPDGVSKINSGDWVTLSPEMAAEYGNVLKMQVPAREITSWPDSLLEFGWFPNK